MFDQTNLRPAPPEESVLSSYVVRVRLLHSAVIQLSFSLADLAPMPILPVFHTSPAFVLLIDLRQSSDIAYI